MNRINTDNNSKLSKDEIYNIFNEIYAVDEKGRYKTLKFYDYAGEICFIGKNRLELNIDEIVRVKTSSSHLYTLLETLTILDIEAIKLSSKILGVPFTEIIFYTNKIDNGLLYVSIPINGGSSIIIDPKSKEYLFAGFIIDFDTHLKKFMSGERTPNFD